jgi:hypothetical protein
MESCPNIGGREIKFRAIFGYVGLSFSIILFAYISLYSTPQFLKALLFMTSMLMAIPFFEVKSETCVVNAFLGLKNMGKKYQKELNTESLSIQRSYSIKIILKGIIISSFITGLSFYV